MAGHDLRSISLQERQTLGTQLHQAGILDGEQMLVFNSPTPSETDAKGQVDLAKKSDFLASLDHLLAAKRNSGNPEDKSAIPRLERLKDLAESLGALGASA